jgi:hypothetical protein
MYIIIIELYFILIYNKIYQSLLNLFQYININWLVQVSNL